MGLDVIRGTDLQLVRVDLQEFGHRQVALLLRHQEAVCHRPRDLLTVVVAEADVLTQPLYNLKSLNTVLGGRG